MHRLTLGVWIMLEEQVRAHYVILRGEGSPSSTLTAYHDPAWENTG